MFNKITSQKESYIYTINNIPDSSISPDMIRSAILRTIEIYPSILINGGKGCCDEISQALQHFLIKSCPSLADTITYIEYIQKSNNQLIHALLNISPDFSLDISIAQFTGKPGTFYYGPWQDYPFREMFDEIAICKKQF